MHWKAGMAGPTRRRPLRGMVFIGVTVLIGGIDGAAEDAQIIIDNSGFSPEPIAVAAGSTIAWVNRDDIPHSIVVPMLGVRSQPMKNEQLFTFRFDTPGEYDYMCGLHPFMHGKVVVEN